MSEFAAGVWYRLDVALDVGDVTVVVVADRAVELLRRAVPAADRPRVREDIVSRWGRWTAEKSRRAAMVDELGRMHPACLFGTLSGLVPDDAVIAVDAGHNTYAFGHYFVSGAGHDVLMSGSLAL